MELEYGNKTRFISCAALDISVAGNIHGAAANKTKTNINCLVCFVLKQRKVEKNSLSKSINYVKIKIKVKEEPSNKQTMKTNFS